MKLRKDNKIALLKRVPLFSQCGTRELEAISRVADELVLPEGTALIREGDLGQEFVIVAEGEVEVTRAGKKVPDIGDPFFGELGLLTRQPRNATVRATSQIRIIVIHANDFEQILLEDASIPTKMLKAVASRLAQVLESA